MVLYARCRRGRARCARMCALTEGRPKMQEWPNAEERGDCGLYGRYMKTWRGRWNCGWRRESQEVAGRAYRTRHSTVLGWLPCPTWSSCLRRLSTPTVDEQRGQQDR